MCGDGWRHCVSRRLACGAGVQRNSGQSVNKAKRMPPAIRQKIGRLVPCLL